MTHTIHPPPRLILGAALLFWGSMTGRPALGLCLALIIESANWIRFRWNFTDHACSIAWRISLMLSLVAGVLIWLDGDRYTTFPKLLTWIPLLLLPLQFLQSFNFQNHLALNNLSFFSKLRRKRNVELGLAPAVVHFNFGNVYFIATLTASSLGIYSQQKTFFIGLVILTGWLAIARVRTRIFSVITLILIGSLIGWSGEVGMTKLYRWATDRGLGDGLFPSIDPTLNKTSIGSLGDIKQSPQILWRLTPNNAQAPPRLIRSAAYNRYKGINWRNEFPDPTPNADSDFKELTTIDLTENQSFYMLREGMTRQDIKRQLPEFEIRGASGSGEPLPIPGNSSTLQGFQLDGIDINPLGTVRIFPQKSIIQGTVRWRDDSEPEQPPFPKADLSIDEYEFEGIHEVADSIGLKELPTTTAKINRLREFFTTQFEYSRYLTIGRARASQHRPTEIEAFLTTDKRGHCEYFATSATLLLRAAGVPTRYIIGYAVMEKNPRRNEWIIRGTHSHAWTRVWDEQQQRWIDFDPTPGGWLNTEIRQGNQNSRWLADTYQRLKEDFFLWRNQPTHQIGFTWAMWILGLGVILFVTKRLWKSRVAINPTVPLNPLSLTTPRTALHDLEKVAAKSLGTRKPGETLVVWLTKLNLDPSSKSKLEEACTLHQQLRFDPAPSVHDHRGRLKAITQEVIQHLKKPSS